MNKLKGFRIATVAAAFVAGSFVVQSLVQTSVGAASQNTPDSTGAGAKLYGDRCAACHGDQLQGNPPAFPPLKGIGQRMTVAQITEMIHSGKGSMPGFPDLKADETTALINFLVSPGAGAPAQTAPEPAQNSTDIAAGAQSYAMHCAICHGDNREGILPGFPPLLGISHLMNSDQIAAFVHTGKGRMPAFPNINGDEMTALVHFLAQPAPSSAAASSGGEEDESGLVKQGGALFHQNCAFCHGRDAMGGETGPDLTASKLVNDDKTGQQIASVIREGRPNNKMPSFNFSTEEINTLIAFIRARGEAAAAHPGGRRGVAVEDLQTGNVEAGRKFFEGAGGCVKCHSAHGDLAGIATRYEGLQLERRMLFPHDTKSAVTVTLPSGKRITGTLAYRDEFTIALRDANGVYRSWASDRVHYTVDSPVEAHVALFPKYTDEDVHNLMAYLQTLR